jgi:hypothetical protein
LCRRLIYLTFSLTGGFVKETPAAENCTNWCSAKII